MKNIRKDFLAGKYPDVCDYYCGKYEREGIYTQVDRLNFINKYNSGIVKNKNFLGITKFNLIRLYTKKKIIALGGINQKNIKKLKLCNVKGVASISWVKKNGPSINTGPFQI